MEEFQVSKHVLHSSLLVIGFCVGPFASAGQLIDERTPPAPVVAAPAAENRGVVTGAGVPAGGTGVGAGAPAATAPTPSEPTPPAPPAPPAPVILAAGQTLSVALTQFVASQGWTLQWGLDYDHFIEADIPLPTGDWQSAVRFLVEAYQAQGGLIGVAPRFATTNRIVYFTKADHAR